MSELCGNSLLWRLVPEALQYAMSKPVHVLLNNCKFRFGGCKVPRKKMN